MEAMKAIVPWPVIMVGYNNFLVIVQYTDYIPTISDWIYIFPYWQTGEFQRKICYLKIQWLTDLEFANCIHYIDLTLSVLKFIQLKHTLKLKLFV